MNADFRRVRNRRVPEGGREAEHLHRHRREGPLRRQRRQVQRGEPKSQGTLRPVEQNTFWNTNLQVRRNDLVAVIPKSS